MIVNEKRSYRFKTPYITIKKKDVIREIAERIRTAKEYISIFVFSRQEYFIENILYTKRIFSCIILNMAYECDFKPERCCKRHVNQNLR